jgi:hypothetical protein
MKLSLLFVIALMSICAVATSADVKHIYSTWESRSKAAADSDASLKLLISELIRTYPDSSERLRVFYEFAMQKTDDLDRDLEVRYNLAAVWRELAPPKVRARFLVSRMEMASASELMAIYGYIKRDLVKSSVVAAERAGTLVDLPGSGVETFRSTEAYRTDNLILSARAVAMLFELAPASVVLDLSDAGGSTEAVMLVESAESARRRLDFSADVGARIAAWTEVQAALREMLDLKKPALDGYIARVVAWGQVDTNLKIDQVILNTLKMRNDPVVNYILAGKGVTSFDALSEIRSTDSARFKSAAPKGLSPDDDARSLSSVSKSGTKNSIDMHSAASTMPAARNESFPASQWSAIVIFTIAACGLLWWLLRRRS